MRNAPLTPKPKTSLKWAPQRRAFVTLASTLVLAITITAAEKIDSAGSQGRVAPFRSQKESIASGHAFLINLFDPELELLPEFHGSKTYWLYHDNYLAARTLADTKPELSRQILATMARFGVTNSGKIEIVFDEARQPLPFRAYQLTNVAVIHGKKSAPKW